MKTEFIITVLLAALLLFYWGYCDGQYAVRHAPPVVVIPAR